MCNGKKHLVSDISEMSDSGEEDFMDLNTSSSEDSVSDNDDVDTDPDSDEDGTVGVQGDDVTAGTAAGTTADDEAAEEDELVKAIMHERQLLRNLPRDIVTDEHVVQLSFHPKEHMIALASINGDVLMHKYKDDAVSELVQVLELHTRSCRDIAFSDDGLVLFSASKDKSMMLTDVESGSLKQAYDDAHEAPLYCLHVISESQVATGDEDGCVKLWDLRQEKEVASFQETDGFISAMITTDAKRQLAVASADGYVIVYSIPGRKLTCASEMYDHDLTSLAIVRNNSKLVVGDLDGKLYIFNWGQFYCHNDVFPGAKQSINKLIAATENIVISACDDGNIRATHLFPHRHLGVIGQHSFPVEALDISGDGRLIASCAHDMTVKFWDISYLENTSVDAEAKADKTKQTHNLPSSKFKNASDFYRGLEND